jgi:nitroreductase
MKTLTDYPIHELVEKRWSPYVFSSDPVPEPDLQSLFEPWAFLVAQHDQPEAYERLLSCLVEANQVWARQAPVLVLTLARRVFQRNNKPNRHYLHDLGLAAAQLTLEATSRGLAVHQMAGILPERVRELYDVPEDWEAATALAIGYPGDAGHAQDGPGARDQERSPRKSQEEFVFAGRFNSAALQERRIGA